MRMNSLIYRVILGPLATAVVASTLIASASAQENAVPASVRPPEAVTLRYLELKNRSQFQFVANDGKKYSKPVGEMTFETPQGTALGTGMEQAQRTFCVEPLVPIYSGRVYDFVVDPINEPRSFGMPETPEGRVDAEKRAGFIRELYGRHYQDSIDNAKDNAPAFQAALWEIVGEKNLPEGPMPFNLFAGDFRADYPNEAEAPEYVRTAQKYLQSLTGDDAPFRESKLLQGSELVRLSGLPSAADGVVPQSQLALRGTVNPIAAGGGNGGFGPGGGGGPGGLSPLGSGGFGGGSGLGRGGLPGGGFGGGGGGGFFGGNNGNPTTVPAATTVPGGTSPQTPETGIITIPPAIRPPENIPIVSVVVPPVTIPPVKPTPLNPNPEPNPVPAPPVILLLAAAATFLGVRKLRKSAR